MSVISERFADELDEKEMRDAYLSAQTRTKLANQVRAIRSQRGWSQGDFARTLGKPQSNVSRLESRDYGNFTLSTLFELASAFDCGLLVEFAPYQDFLARTADLSPAALQVEQFSRAALEALCHDPVVTNDFQVALDPQIFLAANDFSWIGNNGNNLPLSFFGGSNSRSYYEAVIAAYETIMKLSQNQPESKDGDDSDDRDMSVTEYPPSPRRRRPRQPLGTSA